jgi:molybdopterin molybdotransferase
MKFIYATPLSEALQIIKDNFNIDSYLKSIPLSYARGKICTRDIYSRIDIPSFDKAVVDGYALRSEDTLGASDSIPSLLTLKGEVRMGEYPGFSLSPGECAYIPTGGALPQGANAVAMIEHTDKTGDLVCLYKPHALYENVTRIGDDIRKGDLIIPKHTKLSAFELGLLAGAGEREAQVFSPAAYIISTGDELEKGDTLGAAKIFDSNGEMLSAMLADKGGAEAGREQVRDNPEELAAAIQRGIDIADWVIITGGSSVGEKDFTLNCIESMGGKILIKGLAIKPGKPTIIASLQGKPVFGLSGNPVSAAVAFLLLAPALLPCPKPKSVHINAGINFPSSPGRTTFQPVKIEGGLVYPLLGKSGILSALTMADGYILIDKKTEGIYQGEDVEVFLF